jgi:hypothetical protein
MTIIQRLNRLAYSLFTPRVSPSRYRIIKADGLLQYGHFEEALIEAKKARDDRRATAYDVQLAKGKIIEVLNEKKKHERLIEGRANSPKV